jgi:hypothetical protein
VLCRPSGTSGNAIDGNPPLEVVGYYLSSLAGLEEKASAEATGFYRFETIVVSLVSSRELPSRLIAHGQLNIT